MGYQSSVYSFITRFYLKMATTVGKFYRMSILRLWLEYVRTKLRVQKTSLFVVPSELKMISGH